LIGPQQLRGHDVGITVMMRFLILGCFGKSIRSNGPSDNRCPLCGTPGDTNHRMLYDCEYPGQKRIQQQFLTKVGEVLVAQAVEPLEKETILNFWRNPTEFTEDDSQLATALLNITDLQASPYLRESGPHPTQ
jgi:hypothetical protein